MALVLTRRAGQELLLTVDLDLTDAELRRELQAGIRIRVQDLENERACIAITAPQCVNVMRAERFKPDEFERKEPKPATRWQRLFRQLWS